MNNVNEFVDFLSQRLVNEDLVVINVQRVAENILSESSTIDELTQKMCVLIRKNSGIDFILSTNNKDIPVIYFWKIKKHDEQIIGPVQEMYSNNLLPMVL
ncbi:MAG: hypothetical protein WC169_12575 [Dehalococcoidia bacterium]